jgi:hypothetical protein
MTTSMSTKDETTKLANSTYDIIRALETDAKFLYSTVGTYIEDAQKDNRPELVDTWNTIKRDKQRHLQMLREALSKEAKQDQLQ